MVDGVAVLDALLMILFCILFVVCLVGAIATMHSKDTTSIQFAAYSGLTLGLAVLWGMWAVT